MQNNLQSFCYVKSLGFGCVAASDPSDELLGPERPCGAPPATRSAGLGGLWLSARACCGVGGSVQPALGGFCCARRLQGIKLVRGPFGRACLFEGWCWQMLWALWKDQLLSLRGLL